MRTLVISDIHSNIEALHAVFAAAEQDGSIERVLCLGDIVGYGPAPMDCLEVLWARNAVSIQGNHDAAVAGVVGTENFNPFAAEAVRWTNAQLSGDAIHYLANLPESLVDESFLLVHGSPKERLWDYLMSYGQAVDAWADTDSSDLLVGHSHYQFAIEAARGIENPGPQGLSVPMGYARLVVNPGSVGQPRDGDSRAAYAIYDADARMIYLHRVWYEITKTQRAMMDEGLPEPLITRLSIGR